MSQSTSRSQTPLDLPPIHPFPARMASAVVWNALRREKGPLRVLDPMMGSGTTLVVSKLLGHESIGFDTDPLAVVITRAWCAESGGSQLIKTTSAILEQASRAARHTPGSRAYPLQADAETKEFVRYWFDQTNRKQLACISQEILSMRASPIRDLLLCAFSRMIITKDVGASLARDVSHSRPHRVYDQAPTRAFELFPMAVNRILQIAPFLDIPMDHSVSIAKRADARRIPLADQSVDFVITSPPYLNAIDYFRGHKLTLVWMGHRISELRRLRSEGIGAELRHSNAGDLAFLEKTMSKMGTVEALPERTQSMLMRYVFDMNRVLQEIHRVLRVNGRAILVIGDSSVRNVYVRNSSALAFMAVRCGLRLTSTHKRQLSDSRRYLPPPSSQRVGDPLHHRMTEEVILRLIREG